MYISPVTLIYLDKISRNIVDVLENVSRFNLKLISKVFHLHWKDLCANHCKLIVYIY